jgi:hypothetical protein
LRTTGERGGRFCANAGRAAELARPPTTARRVGLLDIDIPPGGFTGLLLRF